MARDANYKHMPLTSKFRSGSVPSMHLRASLAMPSRGTLAEQTAIRNSNIRRFSIPLSNISMHPQNAVLRWSKPDARRTSLADSGVSMRKFSNWNLSAPLQVMRNYSMAKSRPLSRINYDPSANCKMFGLKNSTAMISSKSWFDRRNSVPCDRWNFNIVTEAPLNSAVMTSKITGCSKSNTSPMICTGISYSAHADIIKDRKLRSVSLFRPFSKKPGPHQDESDIITPDHKDSLSNLRARAQLAKDNLCRHKILLDRYLPLHLGPATDVSQEVEIRCEELLARMPLMKHQKSRKEDEDYFTEITPYKPASTSPKDRRPYELQHASVKNSFTPKISETRKKARSVLCKVKGDPHYFDF